MTFQRLGSLSENGFSSPRVNLIPSDPPPEYRNQSLRQGSIGASANPVRGWWSLTGRKVEHHLQTSPQKPGRGTKHAVCHRPGASQVRSLVTKTAVRLCTSGESCFNRGEGIRRIRCECCVSLSDPMGCRLIRTISLGFRDLVAPRLNSVDGGDYAVLPNKSKQYSRLQAACSWSR